MLIRAASSNEAGALSAIAFAAKSYWGYSAQTMQLWESTLAITSDAIKANPTFLADDGQDVMGFYMLIVAMNEWELEHFWVSPQWTRRGIGKVLLKHAVDYVRSHGGNVLRIDADPNAEAFYRACGALRVGEVTAPIAEQPQRIRPLLEISTSS